MRPRSLREAAERIAGGGTPRVAINEFLDEFYEEREAEGRQRMIAEAPRELGRDRLDAYFGAMGEHWARRWGLAVPGWVEAPERFLRAPYFLDVAWRGPQRGFAARPAYARASLGAPKPQAGAAHSPGPRRFIRRGGPPFGISRPFAPTLPAVQTARPPREARALKPVLLRDSPIAFRRRLIFTEAEPLRRARFPKPATPGAKT